MSLLIPKDIKDPHFQTSSTIERLQGAKVLVIGDVMLDEFVYGDTKRISPEAPVPVLLVKSSNMMAGGAGNVVSNLLGLKIKRCGLIAVVGVDSKALALTDMLEKLGCHDVALIADPTRPTPLKIRYIARTQQLVRIDHERTGAIDSTISKQVKQKFIDLLPDYDVVLISDYGKGVLSDDILSYVIEAARQANKIVIVDPKGDDYRCYKGAHIVTPNKDELSQATKMPTSTNEDVATASKSLLAYAGIEAIVATRSEKGMSVVHQSQDISQIIHMPTQAREVYDVSGAGDTVIATIAVAVAVGMNLYYAAYLANIAGGIVVGKQGTAAIRLNELSDALLHDDQFVNHQSESGLVNRIFQSPIYQHMESLMVDVQRWRARGLKVGFTNGCFDILHAGHVSYLNKARAQCDRLIVGLNSDASITRLKGASRPVNEYMNRAAVLSALGVVDAVIAFGDDPEDQDTPVRLIKTIRPDVLVKGADYTVEQVVGHEIVLGYGGQIYLAPLEEGLSTTETIRKLKKD
jgi:D-beta-D-heptose 7-phosphate kinase/D-beta-D-heptose 1-phosphate adenosyltransferase